LIDFGGRYQYDIYVQSWQLVKSLANKPDIFIDIVAGKEEIS
jgi:hypothetical protein